MSFSVLCHNCAEDVDVPITHVRSKIRCPHCGVTCGVPPVSERELESPSSPSPESSGSNDSAEEEALAMWREESPSASAPSPPRQRPKPVPRSRPKKKRRSVSPPQATPETNQTYGVAAPTVRSCPTCRIHLPVEHVICTQCGFNFETGELPEKKIVPMDRTWEPIWTMKRRFTFFAICSGICLIGGIVGSVLRGDYFLFLGPWMGFTGLTAFLLGTFPRIHVVRTKKGKVKVTKTWRFCFVERPEERPRPKSYLGVQKSKDDESGCMELAILIFFLPSIVLAGLWWWFIMRRTTFQVGLTMEHGRVDYVLYRGWDETMMHELAEAMHQVGELPYVS